MNISRALEGYSIDGISDGYAEMTMKGYRSSLKTMITYLGDPEIEDITESDLRNFFGYLRSTYESRRSGGRPGKLSSASVHRQWKAMRSFFKWAERELGTGRPDINIKMPRFTNREVQPFSEDEVRSLLKACKYTREIVDGVRQPHNRKRTTGHRDRALILLLLDTGIRIGECSRLRVEHFNMETGEISIRPHHVGKTRPRMVYLGKSGRSALWRYLAEREVKYDEDPFWLTYNDRPLTLVGLQVIVRRIGDRAAVANTHPHRVRHTFAIQYLRNGGDVFTLQRLLGHSTLDMVQKYLAIADTDAQNAHRKASPADRWRL